jgi:hypothetical protein
MSGSRSAFRVPISAFPKMPRILLVAILVLLVLHQDNWFWTDARLVFGFMPVGLFYHACISIAASIMWFWATKYCWPEETATHGGSE